MVEADFQFLRREKPDVMRYLPKFLAKDEHFKNLQVALSGEHEKQRQALIDLFKQFFIDTATWGLTEWEQIYQTNPPDGASYELRRSLLRAKKMGNRTMTKANLELLINQFVANKDAYINEGIAPGCFEIVFPSSVNYWNGLLAILMEMVPAHLVMAITFMKDNEQGTIYQGGSLSVYKEYTVGMAKPGNQSAEITMNAGGVLSEYHEYTVGMEKPGKQSAEITMNVGGMLSRYYEYTVGLRPPQNSDAAALRYTRGAVSRYKEFLVSPKED
ncbi:MAG: DUF2313 domain-containing protein [Selenomonas sp.]|nr:DUF2313 domain-containing protein [Selenomonas sp.]